MTGNWGTDIDGKVWDEYQASFAGKKGWHQFQQTFTVGNWAADIISTKRADGALVGGNKAYFH